jgi:Ca2+-binding RTX toxin-like protein
MSGQSLFGGYSCFLLRRQSSARTSDEFSRLSGDDSSNTIQGLGGDDHLLGLGGDDLLQGQDGNDIIDGGTDFDTAVYFGNQANYIVVDNGNGSFTIEAIVSNEGSDTLWNIEQAQFADGLLLRLPPVRAALSRLRT